LAKTETPIATLKNRVTTRPTFELLDDKWCLVDRFEYCDLVGNLTAHLRGEPLEMFESAAPTGRDRAHHARVQVARNSG
jgi:hypothetical protein